MKKIFMSFFVMTVFCLGVFAASYNAEAQVSVVGNNLLIKNNIPASNIKFEVTDKTVDNSSFATDRSRKFQGAAPTDTYFNLYS